jgi:hypothetical protein
VLPPDPTTAEWVAAALAAGFVVVLAGVHLVRPAIVRSPATAWGRAAAILLGTAASGVVLALLVLIAAGMRADRIDLDAVTGFPEGAFAGVLVPEDVSVADDIATYASALLFPIAATFGVVAVAVASTPARHGFRFATALVCAAAIAVSALLVVLDAGAAVGGVATAAIALFALTLVCLAVDAARFRG